MGRLNAKCDTATGEVIRKGWRLFYSMVQYTSAVWIWCGFDRASSLICGNKMPTRCSRGFYCRSYCLLNMLRASLCPSSGAESIIQWLLPVVFRAVVFKLLFLCGAEGYVSSLQDAEWCNFIKYKKCTLTFQAIGYKRMIQPTQLIFQGQWTHKSQGTVLHLTTDH